MAVLWGSDTVTEAVLPRPTGCRKTSGRVLHVGVRLGFLRQGSNWSWCSFWELSGLGGITVSDAWKTKWSHGRNQPGTSVSLEVHVSRGRG